MQRPQHQSTAPIGASTYAMGVLNRQDARQQSWFCNLNFVKMAEAGITRTLWTRFLKEKFRRYISVPLALRQEPQTIQNLYVQLWSPAEA